MRGGPSASLFWQDAVKRTGKTYYVWGGDARFNQLYWDKYVTLNPFTAAAAHFPVEEVYSAADVLPLPQFVETPFYKEWMTPQGWCDVLSANLDKSTDQPGRVLGGAPRARRPGRRRDAAPHAPAGAACAALGHDRQADQLSRVEAAAMADTLDGLQAGMFLVDAGRRLVHANASGRAMLNEGNVLHANGRLVAREIHADEVLSDVFVAAGNGDAALAEKGVAARLTARDGDRFVTHVLPLTSGVRRQAGVSYAAVAAVFVQKAGQDRLPGGRDAGGAIST